MFYHDENDDVDDDGDDDDAQSDGDDDHGDGDDDDDTNSEYLQIDNIIIVSLAVWL